MVLHVTNHVCLMILAWCVQSRLEDSSFNYFTQVPLPKIAIIGAGLGGATTAFKLRRLIAIIGAGLGGATTAFKLRRLIGENDFTLDIYEGGLIGGRLRSEAIGGKTYDVGGTVIHPANQHMGFLQEFFDLERLDVSSSSFAIFSGENKLLEVDGTGIWATLTLMWRYGWSLLTMNSQVKEFLSLFERIYRWQKDHHAFTTVPNLLLSMDDSIFNATQSSLKAKLEGDGLSARLIDELVTVATRVSYGQTADNLHALVGEISLAGVESGLWRVKGGNAQLPVRMIDYSNATIIHHNVTLIENITSAEGNVKYRLFSGAGARDYDIVVFASPFITKETQIEFRGFSWLNSSQFTRDYHHTYTYLIQGTPNAARYGFTSQQEMPTIFNVGVNDVVSSFSLQSPADGSPPSNVYKIFANKQLSIEELDKMFLTRNETRLIPWLAYPQYQPEPDFTPFKLALNMYYVNAVELAASAMEMSAISGINVAYLIIHEWMKHDHLIDNTFVMEEKHLKIEL